MARIDIKNSAPMKALAAAKVKYPDFFKAADRIYKDPDAKWDKSICYCPIGLGVTYAVDLADLDSPTLAEGGRNLTDRGHTGRPCQLAQGKEHLHSGRGSGS